METIYDFIKKEQTAYEKPIKMEEGWDWSMKKHLRRSFLYLNSQFEDHNENRDLRPNKNIVLPIMNIQYRTEGFDVKDIELYADNPDEYFKSLLIKKFHYKWALENFIDTFIDDLVFSYCTYGGVLSRKTDIGKPEIIDLRSLAFCNQTSILDYPFCIKHNLSFSQLRKINEKWGDDNYGATIDIESLITLVRKNDNKKNEVEIYELHGTLPIEWLEDELDDSEESEKDVQQIQVVAFYKKEDGDEQGVTLFKHKEPTLPFKFLARDKIENRALGRGGVEELFEQQIWTNWNEIKITEMLDAASKTLHWSDDPSMKLKNLNDMENNEVIPMQEGRKIQQLDTYPRNLQPFVQSLKELQETAQKIGSAEGLSGETPSAGTPFKLYEAQQMEAKSMHKFRQGQLAVFMDEIYRDWVMPHLAKEIVKEQTFLSELSFDEMQEVVEKLVIKKTNQFKKSMILGLKDINEELVEDYKQKIREDLAKKGNKKFLKILKDEMKDISLSVFTNIAGKQKNLALLTDKLTNVLRQYIATPQIRQDPEMTKLLNVILESSGLSPIMFGSAPPAQPAMAQQGNQTANSSEPLKQLSQGQPV